VRMVILVVMTQRIQPKRGYTNKVHRIYDRSDENQLALRWHARQIYVIE
jgi:hypothetical protein